MNPNFKSNERELVKVATFFKRQSRKLIESGKLGEEHKEVAHSVDRFVEQMEVHANVRAEVLSQRETLRKLVRDNAICPRCRTNDKLKLTGTEKDKNGWVSNRYKCRKCNIQFTWNRPNNPWDMIAYIEEVVKSFEAKLTEESLSAQDREQLEKGVASMNANLDQLQPVIRQHDDEYNKLMERDREMEKIIHEFKNSLLIEKIRMDTWENKQA